MTPARILGLVLAAITGLALAACGSTGHHVAAASHSVAPSSSAPHTPAAASPETVADKAMCVPINEMQKNSAAPLSAIQQVYGQNAPALAPKLARDVQKYITAMTGSSVASVHRDIVMLLNLTVDCSIVKYGGTP